MSEEIDIESIPFNEDEQIKEEIHPRNTNHQPFCWQAKKITRLIRKEYKESKSEMSKMLLLYQTLTEIDSDFNGRNIKYYTKTISTYSGLSKEFIPQGLKNLEELGVIQLKLDRYKGKFKGKVVVFTDYKILEAPKEVIVKEIGDEIDVIFEDINFEK